MHFNGIAFNASGPRDTEPEELKALADSRACAITTKTATIKPRKGNPKPRYYDDGDNSVNSMGLPNPGYEEMARRIKALKHYSDKPVFASFSGSPREAAAITSAFDEAGADVLELNLSCPNLGKGKTEAESWLEGLGAVEEATKKSLAAKLPCFLNACEQELFCGVLEQSRVKYLVAVNSPGGGLMLNQKNEIALKPLHGGYGGKGIKALALGNVFRYHEYFGNKKKIIGVGGVFSGRDAFEHLLVGASLVEIGTAYQIHGTGIFTKVENELKTELEKHGFKSAGEAIGKAIQL